MNWCFLKRRLSPVLPLAAALMLAACGDKTKAQSDNAQTRPVLVTQVRFSQGARTRDFVATIRPRVETDVGFRVSGKVMKRFVDVGQRVKAGDILATLDATDLKLQKDQADAELAAARIALEQASADEARATKLRRDGWTAQAALDKVRTAAQEARGRNQRAARSVELAQNALDYATLRADAAGLVTQTAVEAGQVVAAGQTAVRIARAGELEAAVALPEGYAGDAGQGEARLLLWGDAKKTYGAKLRELSASADPATRTFAARFSILGADSSIDIGMTATLTIASRDAAPLASVPLSALYNQGQGPALWKVDGDGKLELTPVTVLRYEAATALVSGGVADGDTIVVLGVQKLDAGQRVRVVSRDSY